MSLPRLGVLLFIVVALVAGAGAAYLAGAFTPAAGNGEAALAAASDASDDGATRPAGEEIAAGGEGADGVAGEEEKPLAPSFDVLRAEPDGSLVVAGRAAPGADVQVLSGSSVLATTEAGPTGDFAAVVDRALQPGEHNIVLRATSEDNVAATSIETAIVSIPSEEGGEVVALVQQPGAPSRLISVPGAGPAPEPPPDDTAGAPPPEDIQTEPPVLALEPDATPSQDGGSEVAHETPPGADPATPQAGDAPETAGDTRPDAPRDSPHMQAGTSDTASGEPAASETADRLSPEGAAPGQEQPPVSDDPSETRAVETPLADQREPGETPAERAEAGAPAAEPPRTTAGDETSPFIEAVEIDGREVFVAGRAAPGRTVRVYVNDILLGQTTVGANGRFLVQTERDLPVGDYIVRVDVLGDDGATVIARAAVPFQRPTGERFAAVAPAPETDAGDYAAGEAGSEGIVAAAPPPAGTGDEAAAPDDEAVAMAPALQPADGAVIIRRGDTLWHISRRVYGHGIRYTTIYMANQDQIRDPDLIWPGQIFALPERTEEGEEADFEAIGDRIVPLPEAIEEREG